MRSGAAICSGISGRVLTKDNENHERLKAASQSLFPGVDKELWEAIKCSALRENHTNGLTNLVFSPLVTEPPKHRNAIWSELLVSFIVQAVFKVWLT